MPVVSARHGDIPFLYGPLGDWLVPERDAVALADRIQGYAEDPETLIRDGRALRARVQEAFDVRRCADRLRLRHSNPGDVVGLFLAPRGGRSLMRERVSALCAKASARASEGIPVLRTNTATFVSSVRPTGAASVPAGRPGLRLALDPFRATLVVITVLTVSRVHQHFPMIARLRPVLVLFLLALLFFVLVPRAKSPPPGVSVESFCPGGSDPDPNVILCESFENPLSGWVDGASNSRDCTAGYNSTCSYDSGILNFDGAWGYSGRYGGHAFTDAPKEHAELYVRYYYRPYSSGDLFGYPGSGDQGEKGVYLRNSGGESLIPSVKAQFCRYPQSPYTTCRPSLSTYGDPREDIYQNQGNDLYVTPGNWYLVKIYIKLNTPGVADGIFKIWADPAPGPSSPTLRLSYNNVYIRGSGNAHGYDYLWLSTYAQACNSNCPASLNKHMRIDQIVVSTADIPAFVP